MAKKLDVYMPLMVGDWLKGTRGMRAEVRGVYINLLLYQWDNGFIPAGMEDLSFIDPEVVKVWVMIKDKFVEYEAGKLRNPKCEEVRSFFLKQRSNGEQGGRPKGVKTTKIISQEKLDWEEMVIYFDNKCLCCGHKFEEDQRPTKDHVIAKINGGIDDISNYQPLCRQCNSSKHATHHTDYRLKYFQTIPSFLKQKWFNNPKETQKKPKHNLHNELELDIESDINNKKERDFKKPDVDGDEIVFPIDTPAVRDLWTTWKKYRWEVHENLYGMMGEQADLKRLQNMDFNQIQSTILTAISNNWKNLYPEKNGRKQGTNNKQQQSASTAEYLKNYYSDKAKQ